MDKIKELIKLAKEEGISSLKYEKGEEKISFTLAGHHNTYAPMVSPAHTTSAPHAEPEIQKTSSFHEIKSPLVGTFYASASPGEPPFVKVGDKVQVGSTLCIIEAMKIMNEVESDIAGEVVEIVVGNESLVEFEQVLFRIKP